MNPAGKQPRIKEEIVRERGYLNKRLLAEDTIEFDHKPQRAKKSYRIIVLRKWIVEERGQRTIAEDFRYLLQRLVTPRQMLCGLFSISMTKEMRGRISMARLAGGRMVNH